MFPTDPSNAAMETLRADLRWAWRALRRHPAFSALAILTIALGIGSTTAIFSVVQAVLLRSLPYDQPDDVVSVHISWTGMPQGDWLSDPELRDLRTTASLAAVGAYDDATLIFGGEGSEPERVRGATLTADVPQALGVTPLLGRWFTPEEDRPNQTPVMLLSYAFWQRRFAGDPGIVGRTVEASGTQRLVLGVLRPEFQLPIDARDGARADWVAPQALDPAAPLSRGSHFLYVVARLAPGVRVTQANAELAALAARLTQQGEYHVGAQFRLWVQPVQELVVGGVRRVLVILAAAVALVLLIACTNVANLLVARAEDRRRELAVRAALGAGRGRLLQQLVLEHGLLAMLGGALGLGLAWIGVRVLVALDPTAVPRAAEITVDGGVAAFALVTSLIAAGLFGLAPALHAARTDLHESLKEGGSRGMTAGARRRRFRRGLVGLEAGLAVLLLVGAGLALRTLAALLAVDPGFEPRGVLTMRLSLPSSSYPEPERVAGFFEQLLPRVRALPGVTRAGAVRVLPLAATIGDWSIDLEGRMPAPGEDFDGDWQVVTPGYFETMGVRVLRGRAITDADRADGPPVVVINETMARQYWPGEQPLGRRFRFNGPTAPWIEVVGVVADEKHVGLGAPVNRKWYRPHAQWSQSSSNPIRAMTLVMRTDGDPVSLVRPAREAIRSLDPRLAVSEVRTLEEVIGASVSRQRFTMLLLAIFAAIALVLAAVGVYGVMSYWVSERTREIGIRMALGATQRQVTALVVREGLVPVLAGVAAGGVVALSLAGVMRGLLYGVAPRDPVTFVGVGVALVAVSVAASWLPARRAALLPPVEALRYD